MGNEKIKICIDKMRQYMPISLQLLVVVWVLWLTLQPVEVRWAYADVILATGIPTIGIVGIINILSNKSKMKITIVDGMVLAWSIYYVGRIWLGGEYPCGMDFLKAMEMMLLYFVLRCALNSIQISAWWLIVAIMGCAAYEALLGIYQMLTGTGRHHLFVLTGTFQNPGPYSAYLMIAAIMGLYIYIHYKKYLSSYIIYAPMLLPWLVLPATWSRAAFVGVGGCALWMCRRKYWKYRYTLWGALAVLAVAFYFIKRGSADGRIVIWMASMTSWMHDVWSGVGVGGFRHACAEGIAEMWNAGYQSSMFHSAGVTDYSYNALLKVLVEQGLVGAMLCVATVAFAMARLYKHSIILFMGMVSLIIFSMFSYPFELLPFTIIVVMVIAWSESGQNTTLCLQVNKKLSIFICLIMMTFGWCLKEEIAVRFEHDKDANLFSGMQNAAFLTDYYELFPYEADNPQYLFDFAKTLRSEKRYMDSNAILRQATLVSADPMFYIIMGNNYRDEQCYDLAERAYDKAYAIMPNRLYPLHQLMMMYADIGENAKAYKKAKELRDAYVKIETKATRQMREKADSIYHKGEVMQCP